VLKATHMWAVTTYLEYDPKEETHEESLGAHWMLVSVPGFGLSGGRYRQARAGLRRGHRYITASSRVIKRLRSGMEMCALPVAFCTGLGELWFERWKDG
jgi:hypothetical protein